MADILGFLRKGFPFISTALSLGGPAGNIAASLVGAALNISKPTPDAITQALSTTTLTSDQVVALKQAEDQLAAQMAQMGYTNVEDMASIAAADRANARDREVKLHDWYPKLLATIVVFLCFVGEGLYFRRGAPSNASPELIGRILGTLDSALILVLGYYFGSSAGSAAKNQIIANQQNGH